jgi:hypothetical protein
VADLDHHFVGNHFFFATSGQNNSSGSHCDNGQRTRTRIFHTNSKQKIASIKQAAKILQIHAVVDQGKPKVQAFSTRIRRWVAS